jgi:hypothetical protein
MAIELTDIRTAVQVYLNTKVQVSVSPLVANVPGVISPGEGFTFSVTAKNAALADGGIDLNNVRYHLRVANSAIGKLIVPPTTIGTAQSASGAVLSAGSQVTEMLLTPPNVLNEKGLPAFDLPAGDSDTISGLKGKAGILGATNIRLDILAHPDLKFLFPNNENSVTASRELKVV